MPMAVLLIDIQNDYFPGGAMELAGAERAAAQAKRVLERCRRDGTPIIHIQHASTRPGSTFFLPGTEGVKIHPAVVPVPGETVFTKSFPNSFRETGLLEHLRGANVDELIIMGMMTHMCVDATVRAAKDYGYTCTVVGDACATRNLTIDGRSIAAADVQGAFLAALGYFYASVVSADDWLKAR